MTDVQRLPRNGLSARELAERIGRSPRTVRRWTSEPRKIYEAKATARHERVRELRAEGMSLRAIATELGISYGAVHYALNNHHQGDTA